MASVLYYGRDKKIIQMLDLFLKAKKDSAGNASSMMQVADGTALGEALMAMQFDVILAEEKCLDLQASDWFDWFRKKFIRVTAPVMLIGEETDSQKIMRYLGLGYLDYILNPPDGVLLIEKIIVAATGKRSLDLKQIIPVRTKTRVDVAKSGVMEEFSEFDCKVRSLNPIPINEVVVLHSEVFVQDGTLKSTPVLARCYSSEEHSGYKGQFLNSYYFVGVTPEILQNIRSSLRKTQAPPK